MERLAMEAQVQMTTNMLQVCREKTLRKAHGSDQLSADEKDAFQNCVAKFFQTPQHVMQTMQQQQQQGGF